VSQLDDIFGDLKKGLKPKQCAMLAALWGNAGNVTKAAEAANIAPSTHYEWKSQVEYATALTRLTDALADRLEAEADRRAVEGVPRKKFHQGCPIDDPDTRKQYVENEFSDTLLIFRLKALRPDKYRERSDVQMQGNVTHTGQVHVYLPGIDLDDSSSKPSE
jgi:hypothetical protein